MKNKQIFYFSYKTLNLLHKCLMTKENNLKKFVKIKIFNKQGY